MKKRLIIILSAFVLLTFLVGITKVTLKVEGEIYLTCEDSMATLPFKKSISTRMFAITSVKKAGVAKAESLIVSLENMFEGATAEYEIKNVKFVR
jgi:hypothetical protein